MPNGKEEVLIISCAVNHLSFMCRRFHRNLLFMKVFKYNFTHTLIIHH